MYRLDLSELIDTGLPDRSDIWADVVLYDVPSTLSMGIRNASANVKRVTIHPDILRVPGYDEFFMICAERGIEVYVRGLVRLASAPDPDTS